MVKFQPNFGQISTEISEDGRNSAILAWGGKYHKPKIKTQSSGRVQMRIKIDRWIVLEGIIGVR
jgi:hypothetical protein